MASPSPSRAEVLAIPHDRPVILTIWADRARTRYAIGDEWIWSEYHKGFIPNVSVASFVKPEDVIAWREVGEPVAAERAAA